MPEYMKMAATVGIKPFDFWDITPAEFKASIEAWNVTEEINDRRTAQICCAIYEVNRNRKKKQTPYKISDFMPQTKEKPKQEQSGEEQMSFLKKKFSKKAGG